MATSRTLARRSALAALVAVVALAALPPPARSDDRVSTLSATLLHARSHEERISAAAALGRLDDRRALGALIEALSDDHHAVRALAAAALGRIGDDSAVAALQKATRDRDRQVRRQARAAIKAILRRKPASAEKTYKVSSGTGDPGFGQAPRALKRPELHVTVHAVVDKAADAAGAAEKDARNQAAERMRAVLIAELAAAPGITMDDRVARKLKLVRYGLDLSLTRCSRRVHKQDVEIRCEIRLAISDDRGKMLSHLTGSAHVKVPRRTFKESHVPQLEIEVVEGAVKGLQSDLLAQLRRGRSP